jgi:uncharacterized protein
MERTEHGEFNWVDLSARDVDAQSAFYQALFGWNHVDVSIAEGMTYRLFKAGGGTVTATSQLPAQMLEQGLRTGWNTCVATDDADATAAKASELGGTVVMPPMDIPGQGRQALVQDPTGAHLHLWKPLVPDETLQYMVPGRLAWNELNTREPEKAAHFYSALLGWDIQQIMGEPTPYWQIKVTGQGEGGIMPMPTTTPADVPAFWLVYFGTDDVEATAAQAVELGGAVLAGPIEIPAMLVFAVLADPAGAVFAVLHGLAEQS